MPAPRYPVEVRRTPRFLAYHDAGWSALAPVDSDELTYTDAQEYPPTPAGLGLARVESLRKGEINTSRDRPYKSNFMVMQRHGEHSEVTNPL